MCVFCTFFYKINLILFFGLWRPFQCTYMAYRCEIVIELHSFWESPWCLLSINDNLVYWQCQISKEILSHIFDVHLIGFLYWGSKWLATWRTKALTCIYSWLLAWTLFDYFDYLEQSISGKAWTGLHDWLCCWKDSTLKVLQNYSYCLNQEHVTSFNLILIAFLF